jgi:hypothetical protein
MLISDTNKNDNTSAHQLKPLGPSASSATDAVGYSNDNENYYDDKPTATIPH